MRVDHAGHEHAPLHVRAPVELLGPLVALAQQLRHLAVQRHQQAAEAHHPARLVERDAVDVVDQRVGESGAGEEGEGGGQTGEIGAKLRRSRSARLDEVDACHARANQLTIGRIGSGSKVLDHDRHVAEA
uniref:Brefeldin A esterase n=1 Tax=Nostoc flagelliforme str. Sunitezuoqi TaxID=676037 RepID=E7DPU2_9NOSO|nr:brefeldin A esterase [Nostoc flagelliforme str. Sunitezuoqi]